MNACSLCGLFSSSYAREPGIADEDRIVINGDPLGKALNGDMRVETRAACCPVIEEPTVIQKHCVTVTFILDALSTNQYNPLVTLSPQ